MSNVQKKIDYYKFYDVDTKFNKILNKKSNLIPTETLLKDHYSNYKDYFLCDSIKKTVKAIPKQKSKQKSNMPEVYFNSLKNKYSILLAPDGIHQQHYGYYKTLEQAEKKCIELKLQLGLN